MSVGTRKKFSRRRNDERGAYGLKEGSSKLPSKQASPAMSDDIVPILAGIAMLATLPGNAHAGWMDNVPPRFVPQTHRTPSPSIEAPDLGSTTGSIAGIPPRHSTHRPTRATRDP